jgi:hypothetical protein
MRSDPRDSFKHTMEDTMNGNRLSRVTSVKVPTTVPDGKHLTLTREGDEVKIETPVSFKTPRVAMEDFKSAIAELDPDG